MKAFTAITLTITTVLFGQASAFAPPARSFVTTSTNLNPTFVQTQGAAYIEQQLPTVVQRQRSSMSSVSTMGLFGLGAPEIAIIAIAAAFLLGPQKLAELGKDAGKIAGELKEVPKEFQAGLAEGEQQAKAMKAEMSSEDAKIEEKSE